MNLRFRFGRRQSVAPSSPADGQSCSNSRYTTVPHFAPGPVCVLVVHRIFSAPYIVGADAATIRLSGAVKQKTLLAVVPRPVQTKDSNLFRLFAII